MVDCDCSHYFRVSGSAGGALPAGADMALNATMEPRSEQARPTTFHICTMTRGQRPYEAAVRNWLLEQGYSILTSSDDPLEVKLRSARSCDMCLLILGPEFGPREPLSSFSHTELEAAAASDSAYGRLFCVAQKEVADLARPASPLAPEQLEFIRRMTAFVGGYYIDPDAAKSPAHLVSLLPRLIEKWRPLVQRAPLDPIVNPAATMISSIGALHDERGILRRVLDERGIAIIDYQRTTSEPVAPRDWVVESARQCRALLLILGPKYGSEPPIEGLGATELEFVIAYQAQRPILAFIRDDAPDPLNPTSVDDADERQFIDRVRQLLPAQWISAFGSAEALAAQVRKGLDLLALGQAVVHGAVVASDTQRRWYRRQLSRWLGKTPHLTQPGGMPLNRVYVSLQTRRMEPLASTGSGGNGGDDDQRAFARDEGRVPAEQASRSIDVETALQRFPRLVLQGNPGSGKTVALKWYAITAPANVTPIYIRLASYARARREGRTPSLREFIEHEERRFTLTRDDARSTWMQAIAAGQAMLLLDALDEAPNVAADPTTGGGATLQGQVRADILSLAATTPLTTPIVVTTRSAGFDPRALEPAFTVTEVQPLDTSQQRQLIGQWLRASRPRSLSETNAITQTILETLQRETHLNAWAQTPLTLTLLTALADASDSSLGSDADTQALTLARVFRHALRLLLGQWGALDQRPGGRYLEAKERLLLALARASLEGPRQELFSRADIVRASKAIFPSAEEDVGEALLNELSGVDGFLVAFGEDEYTFYHPMFQEYLGATWLGSLPAQERDDLVRRRRLDARWEEALVFLVSELDRLETNNGADHVVQTLVHADAQPIHNHRWSDPTHRALRLASRCQGSRADAQAINEAGQQVAQAWAKLLLQDYRHPARGRYTLKGIGEAILALGQAARSIVPQLQSVLDQYHPARAAVIRALAQLEQPEPQEYLQRLWKTTYKPEERVALIQALRRRSSISEASRQTLFFCMKDTYDAPLAAAAAETLCRFDLRLAEDDTLRDLPPPVRAAALRNAYLLSAAEAIHMIRDELPLFSVSDITRGAEARLAALEALDRYEDDEVAPVLDDVLRMVLIDVPRNQAVAEDALLGRGPVAAPAIRRFLLDPTRHFPLPRLAHDENEYSYGSGWQERMEAMSARFVVHPEALAALDRWSVADDPEVVSVMRATFASYRQEWVALHSANPASGVVERFLEDLRRYSTEEATQKLLALGSDRIEVVERLRADLERDPSWEWDGSLARLGKLGPLAAAAIPAICALTQTDEYRTNAEFRKRVLQTLTEVGARSVSGVTVEILRRTLLAEVDWISRSRAAEVIGQLDLATEPLAQEVLTALRQVVNDRKDSLRDRLREANKEYVRERAITALGALWPLSTSYLEDIRAALLDDPHFAARAAAAAALGRLGAAASSGLDALNEALHDRKNAPFGETLAVMFNALDSILATVDDAG